MTKPDIKDLAIKANSGDNAAYNLFLTEVSHMARAYVAGKISNPNQHEDVVQEILLSVHKARHTYNPEKEIKPWLYAIFRFRTVDYLRQVYKNKEDAIDELVEMSADPRSDDVTKKAETNELINKALSLLNETQRNVLILTKLRGHSVSETAEKMGMSISAVKVTTFRALKKIEKANLWTK